MNKEMIRRLTREACEHLSNPHSSHSLRDLCRRFLAQHSPR